MRPRTVTITSAGKSFNLAGLRCAVAHFGSRSLLARRDADPPDLYGAVSVPGVVATLPQPDLRRARYMSSSSAGHAWYRNAEGPE